MKRNKIMYWAATVLIAAAMLMNESLHFTDPAMVAAFKHLGFSDFLREELATLKLSGLSF